MADQTTTTPVTTPGQQPTTPTTPPVSPLSQAVDNAFSTAITDTKISLKDVLQLDQGTNGYVNSYGNGSSVVINADRLILNTKKDHLFVCGKDGVTVTSPGSIHLDCDDDLYMFSSKGEIYLGLPNKGGDLERDSRTTRQKYEATPNYEYEPVVLGIKLANLLEDILVLLRDLIVRGNQGDSRLSPENMTNVEFLIGRIPEILSTTAFVDGYSHDPVEEKPDLGTLTDFFKLSNTTGGTVDPTTFKNELTAVGYDSATIDEWIKTGPSASAFVPAVPTQPTQSASANKDGAVGTKTPTTPPAGSGG